jgi:hypothetical protein
MNTFGTPPTMVILDPSDLSSSTQLLAKHSQVCFDKEKSCRNSMNNFIEKDGKKRIKFKLVRRERGLS